jgi:hypothetical protein
MRGPSAAVKWLLAGAAPDYSHGTSRRTHRRRWSVSRKTEAHIAAERRNEAARTTFLSGDVGPANFTSRRLEPSPSKWLGVATLNYNAWLWLSRTESRSGPVIPDASTMRHSEQRGSSAGTRCGAAHDRRPLGDKRDSSGRTARCGRASIAPSKKPIRVKPTVRL